MNYFEIIDAAEIVCRKAGAFQLQHFGTMLQKGFQDKGLNQLVSFVDIESEKMLVSGLSSLLPSATFITEEKTIANRTDAEYAWVIDPLDGTTNYLHGLSAFCISVALLQNGKPVLALVYAPVWDEMFMAIKGNGAFLNDEKICVTPTQNLNDCLLATGFPYYEFEYMQPYLNMLRYLMKNTHGLRRMGSAAIDLAYTACGRFDGFFELGLSAWDVAAGVLLVQEAGGKLADFKGTDDYIFGKSIIAANSANFDALCAAIKLNFKD